MNILDRIAEAWARTTAHFQPDAEPPTPRPIPEVSRPELTIDEFESCPTRFDITNRALRDATKALGNHQTKHVESQLKQADECLHDAGISRPVTKPLWDAYRSLKLNKLEQKVVQDFNAGDNYELVHHHGKLTATARKFGMDLTPEVEALQPRLFRTELSYHLQEADKQAHTLRGEGIGDHLEAAQAAAEALGIDKKRAIDSIRSDHQKWWREHYKDDDFLVSLGPLGALALMLALLKHRS